VRFFRGRAEPVAATAQRKPKSKRTYTWVCPYCNLEFKTENYNQRYCKPSHKQRAYELRRHQRAKIPLDDKIP